MLERLRPSAEVPALALESDSSTGWRHQELIICNRILLFEILGNWSGCATYRIRLLVGSEPQEMYRWDLLEDYKKRRETFRGQVIREYRGNRLSFIEYVEAVRSVQQGTSLGSDEREKIPRSSYIKSVLEARYCGSIAVRTIQRYKRMLQACLEVAQPPKREEVTSQEVIERICQLPTGQILVNSFQTSLAPDSILTTVKETTPTRETFSIEGQLKGDYNMPIILSLTPKGSNDGELTLILPEGQMRLDYFSVNDPQRRWLNLNFSLRGETSVFSPRGKATLKALGELIPQLLSEVDASK